MAHEPVALWPNTVAAYQLVVDVGLWRRVGQPRLQIGSRVHLLSTKGADQRTLIVVPTLSLTRDG